MNKTDQRVSREEAWALVQQAQAGDQAAFTTLIKRYEAQIAATVIGMLGNTPEADDVGQETFIRFYKALAKFRGEADVGTYLTRIAINLSLNELKKRKRKGIFSLFSSNKQQEDYVREIADENKEHHKDTQEVVQRAVQTLEPAFRSVVVLRMIDGYSTKETAEILNIPLGTVLSRLKRAQEKLKVILKDLN
ncbi:sigma-70 family RNA polymerase sigma factor [uncultured Microscilla sp.]|uniref:RNA polymerase sigma factor n=1 Tax=uncultured Microscilla sp. TaxID=432653 RepID=UPI002611A052|nr:sigma-70 family RNA polymerase sigma factor [uncultured Microscilla sp.]